MGLYLAFFSHTYREFCVVPFRFLIVCATFARFVLFSLTYLSNALLDHLPASLISSSEQPIIPSSVSSPIRKEWVVNFPIALSV